MYFYRYTFLIFALLCLITSILLLSGCEKSEGNSQPTVSPERLLHKGWHDRMSGKIVYTSYYSDGPGIVTRDHLFVLDKDQVKEIPLPDSIFQLQGIEWSPDGLKISFCYHNKGLFVMNSDGTNVDDIISKIGCKSSSWSPDGELIACIVLMNQIVVTDTAGIYYRDFYFGDDGVVNSLDWSPSGTNIAIVHGKRVWSSIHDARTVSLDVSDSTATEILDDFTIAPVWSPDGSRIAYAQVATNLNNARNIYTINKDGSDITQICNFNDLGLDVYCYDLAWSPDGKLIAASSSTGIYIIDMSGTIITKIETDGDCDNLDWR